MTKKAFLSFSPANKQWIRLKDLPSERTYHGSIVVNDSMYLVGGVRNKDIDKYEAATKTFVTVNSMDTVRNRFGMCLYNEDSIIVAGGIVDCLETKTSFLYNTRYNNIKKLGDLNEGKCGLVLINCLGIIFAIGGFPAGKGNQIEKFNSSKNIWEKLSVKLKVGRFQPRAVAHNEFIYIFGGQNALESMESSVEKYNTKTNQITTIDSSLLLARNCFAICKINSEIFLMGGDTHDYSRTNRKKGLNYYIKSVEVFNLKNETFKLGIDLPVADEAMSAVAMKNFDDYSNIF